MRRIITIPLIFVVGGLVLWEVLSWGTRTWTRYGLMKEPLPSITTFLPTSMILPVIATLLIVLLIATTVMALLRSRKIFGIIPVSHLTRHLVLLGPTGSGKTTVAKAIIDKVAKGFKASIVIIDWKGEYHFPGATIIRKLTIWDVPGEGPREKALIAVEMLREISRDVVEVTPASSLLLLKVLEEEYRRGTPTTEKIVRVLETNAELARREGRYIESNMYLALVRRLFILLIDEERKAENEEGDSRVVVYDLKGLPSVYLKTIYAYYILASVYREAYREALKSGVNEGPRTLLVAEESQNYVRHRRAEELPSLPERLIFELRSLGVGVVLVCPDSELLPSPILKDVGTIIATSPDSLPRFVLERHLFRASLEEAEDTLKKLKEAKMTIYHNGRLHFFRRLPRPPKELRLRPKGDRMGVTDSGMESLRAWPILPHRSPGRPKVVEVEERPRPKIVEVEVVEEKTEAKPEVVEVEKPRPKVIEVKTMVEEEVPPEPEPAPEGPPIPSTLPYRGPGRSAQPGAPPHWDGLFF